MTKRSSWLILGAMLTMGCDNGAKSTFASEAAGGSAAAQAGSGGTATAATGSLAEKYAEYFPVGVALGSVHLSTMGDIVDRDFNHLTCENAMKITDIHPAEASFAWEEADYIADYARQRDIKLT
ncbi:MAG TPA: endo-1,4-beta-xylanase, partial [Polyangiaceae bacterium]|nr:endo-1,4-beta-xylanase [Polyangiaceae bacterium]